MKRWLRVPDHRYTALKALLLAALVIYTALVVGANSARDVAFSGIEQAVAAAPGLDGLRRLDENAFQERLSATPEGCEGWLLYGSDDIMNVSELLIAKGGEGALDALESAARARLAAQRATFESYGVDQSALLAKAALWRRGSYLFYAVGEAAGDWEDAFLACVR